MNIIWLDTIDSTNSEALRRLAELPSMTVLAAREQTAGRGQRGNTWFTEPGKNLTFSIIVKFGDGELHASQVHWLNYLISVVVAEFLQSHGIWCKVKWPNDVYVGKNKICGILIENSLKGEWVHAAVVGVGLNVNQRGTACRPHLRTGCRIYSMPKRARDCFPIIPVTCSTRTCRRTITTILRSGSTWVSFRA